jgi:O-acetyl-ADP-ribose deacetylase (regulator of RNase III)
MTDKLAAKIGDVALELVVGNIVQQEVDAVVNAANSSLLGGGGVDGAIHRAAGPGLLMETRKLGGCATGDAKITGGHNLPAKHIIHAVGPVYRPNDPVVAEQLAGAYRQSLALAAAHDVVSVAFPAISTGVYRYPMHEAAQIALVTVVEFIANSPDQSLRLVRFVLFTADAYQVFARELRGLAARRDNITLQV